MVPSTMVQGQEVIVTGRFLRVATVKDEAFVQGPLLPDLPSAAVELRNWEARPHLLTVSEKIGEPHRDLGYRFEWRNFAVIPITTYEEWFKTRIKKDVRENLRRAKREGVTVRTSKYDHDFVRGIYELCNETPIRQGKRFWHYGKSYEQIREVHGTYQDRAEYIGAYLDNELIGFIKMVYVDAYAKTMHVISKERHFHRRPTNALIAKAVEICAERGVKHFVYGEYHFPGKPTSTLTEFKRHNGFEELRYRTFMVPLSLRGAAAARLGLQDGITHLIPPFARRALTAARTFVHRRAFARAEAVAGPAPTHPKGGQETG